METRAEIIRNYISAYNNLDVEGMIKDLAQTIKFQNIVNGELTLEVEGLAAFKKQASEAITYFSQRTQTITSMAHSGEKVEITIDYHAILAIDLPNGLKKGDDLHLSGKSIFTFNIENKIEALQDIS